MLQSPKLGNSIYVGYMYIFFGVLLAFGNGTALYHKIVFYSGTALSVHLIPPPLATYMYIVQ